MDHFCSWLRRRLEGQGLRGLKGIPTIRRELGRGALAKERNCPVPVQEARGHYLWKGARQGGERGKEAIKRLFTPEFRNRLDAVIAFAPLARAAIDVVVERFVLELETRLIDRDVTFDLTPQATRWLAEKGYDDSFSARPLAQASTLRRNARPARAWLGAPKT